MLQFLKGDKPLAPPYSLQEIEAFEKRIGTILPEDLREYLLCVQCCVVHAVLGDTLILSWIFFVMCLTKYVDIYSAFKRSALLAFLTIEDYSSECHIMLFCVHAVSVVIQRDS